MKKLYFLPLDRRNSQHILVTREQDILCGARDFKIYS